MLLGKSSLLLDSTSQEYIRKIISKKYNKY